MEEKGKNALEVAQEEKAQNQEGPEAQSGRALAYPACTMHSGFHELQG
jgi:hypothetical protein